MIYDNVYLCSLSIDTGLNIKEEMSIKDIYGSPHDFTKHHLDVMIGVGWACFLGSWIVNILYYKFHPSAVEMSSLSSFSDKKLLYVFGSNVFSRRSSAALSPAEIEGEII